MRSRGFTLVELVVVVVLLGVMAVSISGLLGSMASIYLQQASRDQLLSQSRFVVERLSRELRDAVPNSVRSMQSGGVNCLEFVPFQSSGRYRDLPLAPDTAAQLSVISMDPAFLPQPSQWLLVFPRLSSDIYGTSSQKIQLAALNPVQADGDGISQTYLLQLASAHSFALPSPARRFYLMQTPVSYCAEGGQIRRYQGYALQALQPGPAQMGQGALMAEGLLNQLSAEPVFQVLPGSLQNNTLVRLLLRFSSAQDPGAQMVLNHMVQVSNVP